MGYQVPSVNIYQQLDNPGGVANITPDLEACIVGPAYNVLRYIPGSIRSLIKTAASSADVANGSMVAGGYTLTFATLPPFSVGDVLLIPGADISGGILQAKVTISAGVVLTLDTAAGKTVTNVAVTKQGTLTDTTVAHTFNLPSQLPGQVIDTSSLQIFVNQALVETLSAPFTGYAGYNSINFNTTTVFGTTLSGVNATTSTLSIEPGDEIQIDYTNTSSVASTFTSSVIGITETSHLISKLSIADILPLDVGASSAASSILVAGATGFNFVSGTGFTSGDTVLIAGAGINGSDLEAIITTLVGDTVTGLVPAITVSTTVAPMITKKISITVKTRKLFNNQLVPALGPVSGFSNFDITNTAVSGTFIIEPAVEIVYGKIISGDVHIGYRALRTDLSGSILAIANSDDNLGVFGEISADNPLALGVSIALANTNTRVRAIAINSNDTLGFAGALDLAQGERVYGLVPLTQDASIAQMFSLHAQEMSTPVNALWRIALVNTVIPVKVPVGSYTADIVNVNSGNNAITLSDGKYVFTASNATFISDNVAPGDTLVITAGTGSPSPVGSIQILSVVSNQQVVVQAAGVAAAISYYVTRTLSKTQRAAGVAAASTSFGSNRLIHVQPDVVVVNVGGTNVVLPGYYLACAVAGLIAGFASQQGFTNTAVAGITDISNSNFTFTRAQLDTMAGAGTFLFVQDTNGGVPYVRHELTTDMTVFQYRELQQVKNWDFLSYFYHDILKEFIGRWNITPDTIGVIRSTINAGSALLKGKKLPRVGAPLTDAKIISLVQDANNVDQLNINLSIKMPDTLNYVNLYLII